MANIGTLMISGMGRLESTKKMIHPITSAIVPAGIKMDSSTVFSTQSGLPNLFQFKPSNIPAPNQVINIKRENNW
jgi:hypothetical protein